jgi:hypothetical protein
MAFWSDAGLDPKRQFKFYVTFAGLLQSGAPHWVVKGVNKPQITIGESVHKNLDKNYYFPGRVEWNTVKFTMVDPVSADGADVSKTIMSILAGAGLARQETGTEAKTTIGKALATALVGEVSIMQINSAGATVETWTLQNAWIKSANFGTLAYDNEDLVNVELEMRYDWATLS